MGAENQPWSLKEQPVFLTIEPFLQPWQTKVLGFFFNILAYLGKPMIEISIFIFQG